MKRSRVPNSRKGRLVFRQTAYRIWTVVVDGKCLWSILQNDYKGRFHLYYREEYHNHFGTLGKAKERANRLNLARQPTAQPTRRKPHRIGGATPEGVRRDQSKMRSLR
jgi:hypothetical protein